MRDLTTMLALPVMSGESFSIKNDGLESFPHSRLEQTSSRLNSSTTRSTTDSRGSGDSLKALHDEKPTPTRASPPKAQTPPRLYNSYAKISMSPTIPTLPTLFVGPKQQALKRHPYKDAQDDDLSLDSECSENSLERLEQMSRCIRSQIRLAEMKALVEEAEKAAALGAEKFAAHPSTYGNDSNGNDLVPKKKDESSAVHPPLLAIPSLSRAKNEGSTFRAQSLIKIKSRILNPEKIPIKVSALRNVTEVIPKFGDLHKHLRSHLTRSGIDESSLLSEHAYRESLLSLNKNMSNQSKLGSRASSVTSSVGNSVGFFKKLSLSFAAPATKEISRGEQDDRPNKEAPGTPERQPMSMDAGLSPNSIVAIRNDDEESCSSSESSFPGVTECLLAEHIIHAPERIRRLSPIQVPPGLILSESRRSIHAIERKNILLESFAQLPAPPLTDTQMDDAKSRAIFTLLTQTPLSQTRDIKPISLFDLRDTNASDFAGISKSLTWESNTDPKIPISDSLALQFNTPCRLRGIRQESLQDRVSEVDANLIAAKQGIAVPHEIIQIHCDNVKDTVDTGTTTIHTKPFFSAERTQIDMTCDSDSTPHPEEIIPDIIVTESLKSCVPFELKPSECLPHEGSDDVNKEMFFNQKCRTTGAQEAFHMELKTDLERNVNGRSSTVKGKQSDKLMEAIYDQREIIENLGEMKESSSCVSKVTGLGESEIDDTTCDSTKLTEGHKDSATPLCGDCLLCDVPSMESLPLSQDMQRESSMIEGLHFHRHAEQEEQKEKHVTEQNHHSSSKNVLTAMKLIKRRLSPSNDNRSNPPLNVVSAPENSAYLQNYLYCIKPKSVQPTLDDKIEENPARLACAIQPGSCTDFALCMGFQPNDEDTPHPKQPDAKIKMEINGAKSPTTNPEGWLDVALDKFDNAFDFLVGTTSGHGSRWNLENFYSPKLKFKKDKQHPKYDGIEEQSKILPDHQFQVLYGITREEYTALSTEERAEVKQRRPILMENF